MATKRPYVPRTTGNAPKQHVDADTLDVGAGITTSVTDGDVTIAANGTGDVVLGSDVDASAGTISGATLDTPTIASMSNAGHDHSDAAGGGTLSAGVITSGTIATARLGSGTADATTYLRGDQTYATPAGTGDVVGPASAVDSRLAAFDSTTGKLLKDSGIDASAVIDANLSGSEAQKDFAVFNASGELTDETFDDATLKATLVSGDTLWIGDSAASGARKYSTAGAVAALASGSADPHLHIRIMAAQGTWSGMPAALTLFRGQSYNTPGPVDLSHGYTAVRLTGEVTTAGTSGAFIALQYSDDDGSSWHYFDSDGADAGPALSLTSTGVIETSWITMDAASKAEVWVRTIGQDGNGGDSPQIANLACEFK